MKKEALEFMIKNKLDKCYECAGKVFKQEKNANDMNESTGKQVGVITHEREILAKELSKIKSK